jgi:hypothetical protein
MSIYVNNQIEELNNEELYYEGIEPVMKSLEICKTINQEINEKFNIFVYWIGDNVNYKHSVVIKSFLATQNLQNATLKIYSDKEISNKKVFERYKDFEQVEFHLFDVEKEIIGTDFENFKFTSEIKNHSYSPAYESDFFRLLMLHKYGGFYIDFDILLLRDLSPLLKYDFLYQWGAYPNNMINGAIMHLRKDSKANKLFTYVLNTIDSRPGIGSLYWASELYLRVKSHLPELVIFPASFFNPEWQSNCHVNLGYLIEPLKKHEYSNMIYDGSFTWHWHNRWNEEIEEGSKFNILDEKIENIFKKKFNL